VNTGETVGRSRLAVTAGPWILAAVGFSAAMAAAALEPSAAKSAAQQNWPAFALVAGLLLIGLVANDDHLFSAVGHRLAAVAPDGRALFAGLAVLIVVVTAVLNLDTSVAFVTPVIVYTAHRRLDDGVVLLVAAILTAAVIAVRGRRQLARPGITVGEAEPFVLGIGVAAIGIAVLLVLLLPSPALAVLAVGLAAAGFKLAARRFGLSDVREVLGLPVLVGLFGLAVGLGTAGRQWSLPSTVLGHLDPLATAVVAASGAVVLNNLPAASLLAAHVPPHPYSLLIGLNIGPNLFATGSLAWVLWIRAARVAGVRAPVTRTTLTGLVAAPVAIARAIVALELVGGRT
jgi:arsenical pump membrane protein